MKCFRSRVNQRYESIFNSGPRRLLYVGIDGLDGTVGPVLEARDLHAAQVRFSFRQNAVVEKEIPLSFELHDGMMVCPADDGVQDHALIGERSVGTVANAIG